VRRADGVHVRLLAEYAPAGAVPVAATLEDAYLHCLSTHRAQRAEANAR